LGALLTGVFATRVTAARPTASLLGLIEGGSLLNAQVVAVLVTWALAIAATFVILKGARRGDGLRVGQSEEIQGLDVTPARRRRLYFHLTLGSFEERWPKPQSGVCLE